MRNTIKKIAIISFIVFVSVEGGSNSASNIPIRREMLYELNDVVSKDFNFSYLEIDSSGENILIIYGVTNQNGKRAFLKLEVTNDNGGKNITQIVQESGLDKVQTASTKPNILTHQIFLEISNYAIGSELCLRNYVDKNNSLKSGRLYIEVQDENVDLIYSESQYNTGATRVCSFLLEPLRLIDSSRVEQ